MNRLWFFANLFAKTLGMIYLCGVGVVCTALIWFAIFLVVRDLARSVHP